MSDSFSGNLSKMRVEHAQPVSYTLTLSGQDINMNSLLGQKLTFRHSGVISCQSCGVKTKKSFNQGYCFRCFQKLAQCDRCIMSPELCHFHLGTCREPDWGEQHCMQKHVVYLANSSGLKVGITRGTQVPTRWIDQGAIQALPIIEVKNRYHSGLVEHACKSILADKTNWRKMLKHDVEAIDMEAARNNLFEQLGDELKAMMKDHSKEELNLIHDAEVREFEYPHLKWPEKVKTHNLDKTPEVEGVLEAIKGQYLILDSGCLNIRKYTSYDVSLTIE